MPALLFLSQLKLIHYVLAGAIIFLLLSLGYSKYLSMQLSASQGRCNAFVAQTDAAAQRQIADNWRISANRDEITRNLELTNAQLQNNLNAKYAARRLLNSSTRGSHLSNISTTSKNRTRGSDETAIVRTMDEIEEGLIGILEQGDKAIKSVIIHEDWEDSQFVVK